MSNNRLKIWAYNPGSRGARLLADMLDCKIIKHEGSKFKGSKDVTVINWGSSKVSDEVKKCKILNNPRAIAEVQDKKSLLVKLKPYFDVPVFTTDELEAQGWIEAGAHVIREDNVYMWDVRPTHFFRLHDSGVQTFCQFLGNQVEIAKATKQMVKQRVKEVKQFLNLDFCSVDIGWVEDTHQAYILKVNTAPELTPELASFYANNFSLQLEKV